MTGVFSSLHTPAEKLFRSPAVDRKPTTLFGVWWSGVLVTIAPTSKQSQMRAQSGKPAAHNQDRSWQRIGVARKGLANPPAHSGVYSQHSTGSGKKI